MYLPTLLLLLTEHSWFGNNERTRSRSALEECAKPCVSITPWVSETVNRGVHCTALTDGRFIFHKHLHCARTVPSASALLTWALSANRHRSAIAAAAKEEEADCPLRSVLTHFIRRSTCADLPALVVHTTVFITVLSSKGARVRGRTPFWSEREKERGPLSMQSQSVRQLVISNRRSLCS